MNDIQKIFINLAICFIGCSQMLLAQERNKVDYFNPNQVRLALLPINTSPIALPDSFIVFHSDSVVHTGNTLQREVDYRMDYRVPAIQFLHTNFTDTVWIHYQKLPLNLRKNYFLQRPLVLTDSLADLATAQPDAPGLRRQQQEEFGANLQKSGSLVRGISIGSNQGLKVDSGLRMQISGEVAEGVEVVAALTDQSTPIQPEGNTQTLQEIDKVFIQLKSEHFGATLGDYYLELAGTEFTRYNRKLQGAMGIFQNQHTKLTLSGAVSKGKFRSQQFNGVEGNQGPYQLTGDRGQIDIIVLAGTERVWIDGVEMVRGENNDYVIEYGSGQITFTRKRLITSDSRITVDFQYSDERFQRNLYAAESDVRLWGDNVQFKTTFLRESDDGENPLGIDLTDENREALAEAGDDVATVEGARFVGEGEGTYVRQDSIWVYVGTGQGDYTVRFSDLGPARGSYVYEGFGRYRFVGDGLGRYAPVILLPKAQVHNVAGFRLNVNPGSKLSLTAEWAASQFDQNSYSSKDDGDNQGNAYLVAANILPAKMLNFGTIEFGLKHRVREARYLDIDRANEIEFNRQWDLQGAATTGNEAITESRIQYNPQEKIRFWGNVGLLQQQQNDLSSERIAAGTQWQTPDLVELDYRAENIERQDDDMAQPNSWLRQNGKVERLFWFAKPLFEYENEIKKEKNLADSVRSGFQFSRYTQGVSFPTFKYIAADIRFSNRQDDDRFQNQFIKQSEAVTQEYQVSTKSWRNLQLSASYTHRERQYFDELSQDTRTDLAEVKLNSMLWERALTTDAHYQITNTQVGKQEQVYFKVPEGEGNYIYDEDLDEYIPDFFGDYVLRLLPTDEFIPVVELKSRLNIRWKPELVFRKKRVKSRWQKWLSAISTQTFVRVEEKTQEPDVQSIYLFNLDKFQNPEFTLFGNQTIRQDIHLFENDRDFSLRYRGIASESINNQFLDGEQRRRQTQHEWRVDVGFARGWAGRFEFIRNSEDKTFAKETRPDRFIRGVRLVSDISYRPKPRLEIAFKSTLARDFDEAPAERTEVRQISFAPRSMYSFRGKGRVRAEFEYTNVTANDTENVIPYELAQGNRIGRSIRWNFTFDYRMSNNLNASINYQGRDEPQRDRTLHLAKVEMRAYF